jgi:GT2 family glycosyltransferase
VGLTLNYRDEERTSRCVRSLLDDGAHAVLVWDNSEDNGASAQSLREIWRNEPRVVIEQCPRNLGFAAGVNRGLEAILERLPNAWVMLLNNDAVVRPGALAALCAALRAQPDALIAYPRVDHGGRLVGTAYYQRVFALLRFDRPWPGSFPYPSGSALLIAPERTEMPLFDEDFFMYGEDVLLGWRLGPSRMAHVPEVLVFHEGSATSRNGSLFYEIRLVESHLRLADKLAKGCLDPMLLLLGRAITLPARAAVRAVRYRSFTPIKALWQGWRMARYNVSERWRAQNSLPCRGDFRQ